MAHEKNGLPLTHNHKICAKHWRFYCKKKFHKNNIISYQVLFLFLNSKTRTEFTFFPILLHSYSTKQYNTIYNKFKTLQNTTNKSVSYSFLKIPLKENSRWNVETRVLTVIHYPVRVCYILPGDKKRLPKLPCYAYYISLL